MKQAEQVTQSSKRSVQRPRVLHVLEATGYGALRYVRDFISTLPNGSFELALAYSTVRADPGFGATLEETRAKGWQLFPVKMLPAVSPIQDLRSVRHLRQVLRTYRPQIVHCHSSKAGALGRIAALGLSPRPRVVYTPNALAARLGLQYLVAERLLAPLTDRFVAISESERDEIVKYGLASNGKVDVVYPCFDLAFYNPQDQAASRAALGLPNEAPLMIGVGRLTDQKDPLMFVEIVRRVAAETKSLKAIWLGDGPLREVVESEVRRNGLEGVIELPGWQADMRPWFAAADLLLSTSKYESFGYMVAEALAMKCPVVATSITGTTDIMNGELERFLYPTSDAAAAVERILELLRNPTQAKEIGRLGCSSIEERFSSSRMAQALTTCYTKLIAGSNGRKKDLSFISRPGSADAVERA
jgi:glycosyltransferase involved in cell wall biosynthesis